MLYVVAVVGVVEVVVFTLHSTASLDIIITVYCSCVGCLHVLCRSCGCRRVLVQNKIVTL